MHNQIASARIIQFKDTGETKKWKIHVSYDEEDYLILITDQHTVSVYLERELPDSPGVVMGWPTGMTGLRSVAIECARRMRYGEHD